MSTAMEIIMDAETPGTLVKIISVKPPKRGVSFEARHIKAVIQKEEVRKMLAQTALKSHYDAMWNVLTIWIDDPDPLQNPQLSENVEPKEWDRVLIPTVRASGTMMQKRYRCQRCQWLQDHYTNFCPNCGLDLMGDIVGGHDARD